MNCNLNSQIKDEKHIMHMYYYILSMYICMQYTEKNSLNKNRIYSFTRDRQHLCGHDIVLWTLLFTMNTVLVLLGAVHKLCRLGSGAGREKWPILLRGQSGGEGVKNTRF
jgi:hypothetical protein